MGDDHHSAPARCALVICLRNAIGRDAEVVDRQQAHGSRLKPIAPEEFSVAHITLPTLQNSSTGFNDFP
jgi:hypothetical protein